MCFDKSNQKMNGDIKVSTMATLTNFLRNALTARFGADTVDSFSGGSGRSTRPDGALVPWNGHNFFTGSGPTQEVGQLFANALVSIFTSSVSSSQRRYNDMISAIETVSTIPIDEWRAHGCRMLRRCVRDGDVKSLERMVDLSIDVIRSENLLHLAVTCGRDKVIDFFRSKYLNDTDARGDSNIHLKTAVHAGDIKVITALRLCGLTYNDVTEGTNSSLDIALRDESDDVLQYLTRWRIEEAFTRGDLDDMCGLCAKDFFTVSEDRLVVYDTVIGITDCKHLFHDECLNRWIKGTNTCPLCQDKMNGYSIQEIPTGTPESVAMRFLKAHNRR